MTQETRVECPSCKRVLLSAAPIPAGKKVKCPKCGTMIEAPAPAASAANTPADSDDKFDASAAQTATVADKADVQPAADGTAVEVRTPSKRLRPARFMYVQAANASAGLFVLCGLWVAGSALVTLNSGSDWFGRGPNVIIEDDEQRSVRFHSMFLTVLAAGVALIAVGVLMPLRQGWVYFLGFPVAIAAGLILFEALFASNAHIIIILGVVLAVMLMCADLVWVLYSAHEAKLEREFVGLRGDEAQGGIESLIRLLQHPKRGIRLQTIHELKEMGSAAAPAVPALIEALEKATPPDLSQQGVCMVCGQKLSVWTRDKIKTDEHPAGVPACLGCRKRLVEGSPSETQFVVGTLAAIGPEATAAIPALRTVAGSVDPLLRNACRETIQVIQGK